MEAIVCDVVKHLQKCEVPIGSRIWWCPTSFLTTLPFHAAGKNGKKGGKGEFLMDYYISSYTSTLKALIDARNLPVVRIQQHQILVVAQPSDHNLPSAQNELDTVCGCIQDHDLKQIQLVDEGATNSTVKNTLKSCSWVHFICHGEISATSPFDSSLHLFEGERLSLNDIITAHLPDAQFAFLAACHSAEQIVSGPDAPEVVLHLAIAMQFSGFRSVIGTLWEMRDEDGPYIAKRFYEKMLEGKDNPEMRYKNAASALTSVIQHMREQKVMNEKTGKKEKMGMDRWVNYVHIGA
ncbi:CHAT domain-containing protein [Pleurotus pulmonarius]